MSTRATYMCVCSELKDVIGLYSPFDGNPEEAAKRFKDALLVYKRKERFGLFAECLLRVDESMLITTEDHDIHDDTEYRYTITEDVPGILNVLASGGYGDDWGVFFTGRIEEFIRKYLKVDDTLNL